MIIRLCTWWERIKKKGQRIQAFYDAGVKRLKGAIYNDCFGERPRRTS